MRRGTTPTLSITVDADVTEMQVYLALKSGGRPLVVKRNADLEMELDEGKTLITARLTQADTLAMKAGEKCEVQLRAVTDAGKTAIATNIATIPVQRILQDGELNG